MGRHLRLLLCSAASLALIGAGLSGVWFQIELGAAHLSIDLRSARMCTQEGMCTSIDLGRMGGAYPAIASIAFWAGLALALLVLVQGVAKVFAGWTSPIVSRIGYALGSVTFLCAFGGGYLFGPETESVSELMGIVVARSFAPVMLLAGSLLGMVAVRYALLEGSSDDVGEYKPIVLNKDLLDSQSGERRRTRAPTDSGMRTPSQPVERIARGSSDSGSRTRTSSQQLERIALPGDRVRAPSEPGMRTRTPSQQVDPIPLPGERPHAASDPGSRSRTTSQQVEYIPLPGHRTKSPSEPSSRTRSQSQQLDPIPLPGERPRAPTDPGSRSRSTSQQVERIALPGDRTKSPSEAGRTKSPSGAQPVVARTASSQQPAIARTSSSQPAIARTASPSQQPMVARTSSSQGPADDSAIPSRARTSSSGPIDLAARLSGAPIAVSIKPPLPEPIPVPPDQIPVAPESGLVIRKRTPSAGPISPNQIPISPESGLVIRTKAPTQDAAPQRAFGSTDGPRGASGFTPPGAMPSIGLRHIDPDIDNPLAKPVQSQLPADPVHADAMSGLGPAGSAPAVARAFTPPDKPPALRHKLKYAVNLATLTSMGITAQREDGTTKHVGWDDVIGVIARRLPAEAPYEGVTMIDLVSIAGSTLRILPWTRLDGAPVRGAGEERARAFLQLVAARCLEAKLDSWTKVFADGAGHAAQLPSAKTLAAHDDKLA